ncbi:MAG: sodium:solute symporter family protein, partial [Acidobacteriota bacterium]|nr:sodium:solute symporter family protein [Acidobacteriota bacterium]
RASREGAVYGLLAGCAVTLALNIWPEFAFLGIHPGIYGAVANVLVMVVVSLRTDPPAADRIEPYMMRTVANP